MVVKNEELYKQYMKSVNGAGVMDNETLESFRISWEQAMRGEALLVSELWEGIDPWDTGEDGDIWDTGESGDN